MHGRYFTNTAVPWDADKYCEMCVEEWLAEEELLGEDEEDEDELWGA
jgi:hypothetical protein